jgi:hypothetical protein
MMEIGEAGLPRSWLAGLAGLAGGLHWLLAAGFAGASAPTPMVLLAVLALGFGWHRMPFVRVTGRDLVLFGVALLACALPFRTSTAVALAAAAALSWRTGGIEGRSCGVLLMALAGWGLKDGLWAGLASVPVLWLEAHVTAFLATLLGVPAEATGNRIWLADGQSFVILRACSVLALAYPCAVGTYALCRLVRPGQVPGTSRILVSLALLALANTARLVGMVCSPAVYDYLHYETGTLPLQTAWAFIVLLSALPGRRLS